MEGHADPNYTRFAEVPDELRSTSKAVGFGNESRASHKPAKSTSSLAGRVSSTSQRAISSSLYTRDAVSALEQFPVLPARTPHEPLAPKQVKRGRAGAQMPVPLTVLNVHSQAGHHDSGSLTKRSSNHQNPGGGGVTGEQRHSSFGSTSQLEKGERRAERVADMVAHLTELFQRKLMQRMEQDLLAQQQQHRDAAMTEDEEGWSALHPHEAEHYVHPTVFSSMLRREATPQTVIRSAKRMVAEGESESTTQRPPRRQWAHRVSPLTPSLQGQRATATRSTERTAAGAAAAVVGGPLWTLRSGAGGSPIQATDNEHAEEALHRILQSREAQQQEAAAGGRIPSLLPSPHHMMPEELQRMFPHNGETADDDGATTTGGHESYSYVPDPDYVHGAGSPRMGPQPNFLSSPPALGNVAGSYHHSHNSGDGEVPVAIVTLPAAMTTKSVANGVVPSQRQGDDDAVLGLNPTVEEGGGVGGNFLYADDASYLHGRSPSQLDKAKEKPPSRSTSPRHRRRADRSVSPAPLVALQAPEGPEDRIASAVALPLLYVGDAAPPPAAKVWHRAVDSERNSQRSSGRGSAYPTPMMGHLGAAGGGEGRKGGESVLLAALLPAESRTSRAGSHKELSLANPTGAARTPRHSTLDAGEGMLMDDAASQHHQTHPHSSAAAKEDEWTLDNILHSKYGKSAKVRTTNGGKGAGPNNAAEMDAANHRDERVPSPRSGHRRPPHPGDRDHLGNDDAADAMELRAHAMSPALRAKSPMLTSSSRLSGAPQPAGSSGRVTDGLGGTAAGVGAAVGGAAQPLLRPGVDLAALQRALKVNIHSVPSATAVTTRSGGDPTSLYRKDSSNQMTSAPNASSGSGQGSHLMRLLPGFQDISLDGSPSGPHLQLTGPNSVGVPIKAISFHPPTLEAQLEREAVGQQLEALNVPLRQRKQVLEQSAKQLQEAVSNKDGFTEDLEEKCGALQMVQLSHADIMASLGMIHSCIVAAAGSDPASNNNGKQPPPPPPELPLEALLQFLEEPDVMERVQAKEGGGGAHAADGGGAALQQRANSIAASGVSSGKDGSSSRTGSMFRRGTSVSSVGSKQKSKTKKKTKKGGAHHSNGEESEDSTTGGSRRQSSKTIEGGKSKSGAKRKTKKRKGPGEEDADLTSSSSDEEGSEDESSSNDEPDAEPSAAATAGGATATSLSRSSTAAPHGGAASLGVSLTAAPSSRRSSLTAADPKSSSLQKPKRSTLVGGGGGNGGGLITLVVDEDEPKGDENGARRKKSTVKVLEDDTNKTTDKKDLSGLASSVAGGPNTVELLTQAAKAKRNELESSMNPSHANSMMMNASVNRSRSLRLAALDGNATPHYLPAEVELNKTARRAKQLLDDFTDRFVKAQSALAAKGRRRAKMLQATEAKRPSGPSPNPLEESVQNAAPTTTTDDEEAIVLAIKDELNDELKDLRLRNEARRTMVESQERELDDIRQDMKRLTTGKERQRDEAALFLAEMVDEYTNKQEEPVATGMDALTSNRSDKTKSIAVSLRAASVVANLAASGPPSSSVRRYLSAKLPLTNISDETAEFDIVGGGYTEKQSVACQTELFMAIPQSEEQRNQVEELFHLERHLLLSVRRLMIAVANIMVFHNTIEIELTCKACLRMFDQPRTLWVCGHTFCHQCVIDMFSDNEALHCKECEAITEVGFTQTPVLELIVSYHNQQQRRQATIGDAVLTQQQQLRSVGSTMSSYTGTTAEAASPIRKDATMTDAMMALNENDSNTRPGTGGGEAGGLDSIQRATSALQQILEALLEDLARIERDDVEEMDQQLNFARRSTKFISS